MGQTWRDLLFMHWPIEKRTFCQLIPPPFELDLFDGSAWIGVVPFLMTNIHFRNLVAIPGFSSFAELNVRTYVRYQGKPGVHFFSLDAANFVAVEVARLWYHLPYYCAQMSKRDVSDTITYTSKRIDRRGSEARLEVDYRPVGEPFLSSPDSLDAWLTERYCLYTVSPAGQPLIGEIHHRPWPLQKAEAQIKSNSMAQACGIQLPSVEPILHFARELETVEWPIASLNTGSST
jgi:uncharacterized protein YqjF (DUF2071 family)